MASDESGASSTHQPGLLESLKRLIATGVAMLQTRVEIFASEIEEERERLRESLILGLAALFCIAIGAILFTLFLVMAFWDTHRLAVLAGLSGIYIVLGLAAAARLRYLSRSRPRPFATTLAELAKDREHLTSEQR